MLSKMARRTKGIVLVFEGEDEEVPEKSRDFKAALC